MVSSNGSVQLSSRSSPVSIMNFEDIRKLRRPPLIPRKIKKARKPDEYKFTRNKNRSKSSLIRLKGKFLRQIKRTFPKNLGSLFLKDLQPTWAHFLDEYGKGDQDLSNIGRPQCFNDYGFMAPPEAINESKRTTETKNYIDRKRWDCTDFFYNICHPMLDEFNVTGISVSLLDRTRQIVKFSINHPLMVISRNVSMDGHAILSKGSFVLLDASRDWRMLYNPMVHGPPFIRFYAAVPLVSKTGIVIGALAVFDPYIRCSCPPELIERLHELAATVISFVDQTASSISPRAFSSNTFSSEISKGFNKSVRVNNWGMSGIHMDIIPEGTHLQLGLSGLRKLNCNPSILHSFEISQELMESHNALAAVERAAQILVQALGLNVAYIIEIRTSVTYNIPSVKLKNYQSGEEFDLADRSILGASFGENTHIRLLGGYGLPKEDLKFDPKVHSRVLNSEYGMHFDNSEYP